MNIQSPTKAFFQLPGMKRTPANDREIDRPSSAGKRIPGIGFMPNRARNHFIALLGEFIGTFMFLFFAFTATQVANAAGAAASGQGGGGEDNALAQAPNAGVLLYIALAFGFSLAVNAWVFFRISGGVSAIRVPGVTLLTEFEALQSSRHAGYGPHRCRDLDSRRHCVCCPNFGFDRSLCSGTWPLSGTAERYDNA